MLQAPTAGANSWKRSHRRDSDPGGPNVYSKGMYYITDQEQHWVSLLPYQGYTVTQRQVIEWNIQ